MKDFSVADIILGTPQKKKRKTIPQSVRTRAYMRSKGKCERCHTVFEKGLKPHIHHKDGDPKNNKVSNLDVLCLNVIQKHKLIKNQKQNNPPPLYGI